MARSSRIDLFGPFVETPVRAHVSFDSQSGGVHPPSPPHREVFDAQVLPVDFSVRRRCATLPCSVALHAIATVALIAVPLLASSELPGPPAAIRAFFVEPMIAPPPPPPPPAPVAGSVKTRTPPTPPGSDPTERLTVPVEVPSELRPEEGLDLGIAGGVPGGVAGGIPGGVVGGVVGGLPAAPSAPPPLAPVRVGGEVNEPVKVHHVDPVYPKVAMDASIEGIVIIDAVIDATGRISEARVLRGVPILEEAALEAVRQWRYTPTLLDGVPTPVRMTITVTFRFKRPLGR
jgi:protein TonB